MSLEVEYLSRYLSFKDKRAEKKKKWETIVGWGFMDTGHMDKPDT